MIPAFINRIAWWVSDLIDDLLDVAAYWRHIRKERSDWNRED